MLEEKQEVPKPPSETKADISGNSGGGGSSHDLQQPPVKDADAPPEMDPDIGDPANVIGNIGSSNAANNNFVNNTNAADPNYLVGGDEKDFDERLRSILKCHDKAYEAETLQRGDFWVLKNYVRAEHGELKCHESITYTTHADYTFLDNLIPLLER